MSDYTKNVDYSIKDGLASGNPAKVIKGTELNTEFDDIASASASKANSLNSILSGTTTATTVNVTGLLTAGTIDGGTY